MQIIPQQTSAWNPSFQIFGRAHTHHEGIPIFVHNLHFSKLCLTWNHKITYIGTSINSLQVRTPALQSILQLCFLGRFFFKYNKIDWKRNEPYYISNFNQHECTHILQSFHWRTEAAKEKVQLDNQISRNLNTAHNYGNIIKLSQQRSLKLCQWVFFFFLLFSYFSYSFLHFVYTLW